MISLQQAAQDALALRNVEAKLTATARLLAAWRAGALDMEAFTDPIDTVPRLMEARGLDAETTYREFLATPGVPQPRRPFNLETSVGRA